MFPIDDSGRWGKGGLFDALSARSTQPQMSYEQAGKMRDLTLGDAHLIPIDDLQSREQGRDMVSIVMTDSCCEVVCCLSQNPGCMELS